MSTRRGTLWTIAVALCLAGLPQAWAAPGAGDPTPDGVVGKNLDGEAVQLKGYSGKVVVLTFWATWCPYCLKELPVLERIQNAAGTDKLQVIAVNTEELAVFRRATPALKDVKLLMVHDSSGEAARSYGVHGIPHLVIVGRSGQIVQVYRGYDESSLGAIVEDINRALATAEKPLVRN